MEYSKEIRYQILGRVVSESGGRRETKSVENIMSFELKKAYARRRSKFAKRGNQLEADAVAVAVAVAFDALRHPRTIHEMIAILQYQFMILRSIITQ